MLGLARQFHDHITAVREYQRKIEREKLMIDGDAIVLVDEFFSHAIEPYLRNNQSSLAQLFKKRGVIIYANAVNGSYLDGLTRYPIQYEQLTDEMKEHYRWVDSERKTFQSDAKNETNWDFLSPLERHIDHPVIRMMWRGEIRRQMMDERPCDERQYIGLSLDDFFRLANGVGFEMDKSGKCLFHGYNPNGSHFNDAEKWSILKGDGRNILRFWQDVSSLRDYSGFFPHKPKPKGNNDRQKPQAVLVGSLQPAWGRGF